MSKEKRIPGMSNDIHPDVLAYYAHTLQNLG